MKTAEEYIQWAYGNEFGGLDLQLEVTLNPSLEILKRAINEARKEAIEECAKSAIAVNSSSTAFTQSLSGQTTLGQMINQRVCYVDKQSILSLINKLK